jgi:membrane protein
VWPAAATAAARAANERLREVQIAEYVARAAAVQTGEPYDPDDADMPSEFPERWSRFLPPEDLTSRLRKQAAEKVEKAEKNGGAP